MQPMKGFLTAAIVAALSACTPLSQTAPVKQAEFTGDYKAMATCIALKRNDHNPNSANLIVDEQSKLAVIDQPAERLTLRQISEDKVLVQRRQGGMWLGEAEWIWGDVERCAASI